MGALAWLSSARPSFRGLTTGRTKPRLLGLYVALSAEPSSFRSPAQRGNGDLMKAPIRPCAAGLALALFAGSAIAAPYGTIGGTEIFLGLLLIFWIGLPLLLLAALIWRWVCSFIASLRRPVPVIRAPDTDLMA
jgi:hypothetical protein